MLRVRLLDSLLKRHFLKRLNVLGCRSFLLDQCLHSGDPHGIGVIVPDMIGRAEQLGKLCPTGISRRRRTINVIVFVRRGR